MQPPDPGSANLTGFDQRKGSQPSRRLFVYWGNIGIMEKKMETTGSIGVILG